MKGWGRKVIGKEKNKKDKQLRVWAFHTIAFSTLISCALQKLQMLFAKYISANAEQYGGVLTPYWKIS